MQNRESRESARIRSRLPTAPSFASIRVIRGSVLLLFFSLVVHRIVAGCKPRLRPRHPPDPFRQVLPLPRPRRRERAKPSCGSTPATAPSASAIVPGEPDESELIARITSDDESMRMPPPDSNLSLTDAEKELLRDWIAAGANTPSTGRSVRCRPRSIRRR